MNEDYLWDGSGEKDELIGNLENLFSELRFNEEKNPLAIVPPAARTSWLRGFRVPIAIAASILFLVTAAIVGPRYFNRSAPPAKDSQSQVSQDISATVSPTPVDKTNPVPSGPLGLSDTKTPSIHRSPGDQQNAMAKRRAIEIRRANQLAEERREGEQAKNELMLALHIAGSKLNQVQKSVSVNKG